MTIVKQQFTITYEREVDTDTGEIIKTSIVNTSDSKEIAKKKVNKELPKDSDTEPKLYLEDNKCRLNSAAVSILGINVGDKVDINYAEGNNGTIPVIGTEEAFGNKGGTKFTKSGTFSYRGVKNEQLAKYGNEFTLVTHPTKQGLFILTSEETSVDQLKGDENVNTEEDIDINLDDLVEDNTDATEIDSNFFKL